MQLILDYDRADIDPRGNLRVAAMQSQVGQLLLGRLSEKQRTIVLGKNKKQRKKKMDNVKQVVDDDAEDDDDDEVEYKSIVVITPTTTHLNSNACLHIGHELSGPLRILSYIAGIIPTFLRDILYKLLSKNRKRLFGSSTECRLWDDNWDTRFVDDAVVTGGQSMVESMDPFADPNSAAAAAVVKNRDNDDSAKPLLHPGDIVRVVMGTSAEPPVVHTHIPGYDNGICTIGSVGTVTRVLDERAYPKNVAVKFDLDVGGYCDDETNDSPATTTASGGDSEIERKGTTTCSFEAHFFPWQLRKE